jgi:Bacteriophage probable baseplate hub protein
MSDSRTTKIFLAINGQDVTADLAGRLMSFRFDGTIAGNCDSVIITCVDPTATYRNVWPIRKGTPFQAKLQMLNWSYAGESLTTDYGIMWVDAIDFQIWPRTMTIKATSLNPMTTGKGQHNFDGVEGMSLKDISNKAATNSGLQLVYNNDETNPVLARSDQVDQSDLERVQRMAQAQGLSVKSTNGKLWVFDEKKLEANAAFTTITDRETPFMTGRLRTNVSGLFKKGKLSYMNPKAGKVEQGEFTPEEPPEGTGSEQTTRERPDEQGSDDSSSDD